ncbi:MAG: hypothetical protein U0798_01000 [Gemmataceae bacterium]
METEYLCVTILARTGEGEPAFKTRISEFWTGVVRGLPDLFEKVYAETTAFEPHAGRLSRKYLVEADAATELSQVMGQAELEHLPLDPDDLYTKYEAAPPEWFWIEH